MKAIKIITALLLTAALVGCNGEDTDIDSSETLPMTETELTDSMTVIETQSAVNEAAAPEDMGRLLDTFYIFGFRVELLFDNTSGSLAKYYAVSYSTDDLEGEKPLCTVGFYEDEYTENTKLVQRWSDMTMLGHRGCFTVSDQPADSKGTVMLFDIDNSGTISLYSYEDGHEIPAEAPGINDEKYRLYDYGSKRYAEYSIDPVNKTVTFEGELEYRSDIGIAYLAMRTDCMMRTFSRQMTQCGYGDLLTEAGSRDTVRYYRVSPDFAASLDELRDMIDTAFTDEFAEKFLTEDPFIAYGDTPAMFTEDSEGIIYSELFRSNSAHCDYNTVKLITGTDDPGTAEAWVMDNSPYLSAIKIMYFDMTAESCPAKDIKTVAAGAYFTDE